MVITASASSTASATDAAGRQPRPFAFSSASAERSKARTSCPALARFPAMPPPMLPSPMYATRAISTILSLSPQRKLGSMLCSNLHRGLDAGLRRHDGKDLASLPVRRALVDEGGHAFLLVLGAEQAVEQP